MSLLYSPYFYGNNNNNESQTVEYIPIDDPLMFYGDNSFLQAAGSVYLANNVTPINSDSSMSFLFSYSDNNHVPCKQKDFTNYYHTSSSQQQQQHNNSCDYTGYFDYFQAQPVSPSPSFSPQRSPLDISIACYDNNTTAANSFMSLSPLLSSLTEPIKAESCSDSEQPYCDYSHADLFDNERHPFIKTETLYNEYESLTSIDNLTVASNSCDYANSVASKISVDNKKDVKIQEQHQTYSHPSSPESALSVTSLGSKDNNTAVKCKKSYSCDYCDRSFARKYDVARHKRIHTGSKPYVCPCCLRSFSRSDARVRHFRTEVSCHEGTNSIRKRNSRKASSHSSSNIK